MQETPGAAHGISAASLGHCISAASLGHCISAASLGQGRSLAPACSRHWGPLTCPPFEAWGGKHGGASLAA
jgi:hypothetical protein